MIEYGAAWTEGNHAERVVSVAGRIGATQGRQPFTDFEILQAVNNGIAGQDRVEVNRVIVYRVTGDDPAPPASCAALRPSGYGSFGVGGLCNVYSPEQVGTTNPGTGFPRGSLAAPSCAGAWDVNWCPMSRDLAPPGVDRIGVEIELEFTGFTNFAGSPETITRRSVHELEPETVRD
jgi:hypothetical protein